MNLLAIETSTAACSVALFVTGRVLQRSGEGARMHAEVLLPWVHQLLAEAGISFAALDGVAADRGPGGFTSLRLGLGVAQGIAVAHDLPCFPVSSLRALALAARPEGYTGPMLAALDARMGELYTAWYEFCDAELPRLQGRERLLDPANLQPLDERPFVAAGNARAVHGDRFSQSLNEGLRDWLPQAWPTAAAVARLAQDVEAVPPDRLEAVYLRDRVADAPDGPSKTASSTQ